MPAMPTRTGIPTTRPTTTASEAAASGVLVVDKPAGWTSHQVVGRVRRLLGTRKVGHAGTLDPMATGVLVIGAGRATRLLGYLMRGDKSYAATIRLGARTVTDDAEGEVIETPGAAGVTAERVAQALTGFRGPIEQVPSAVSAIKVDGVRSYARVRSGSAVELAPRPVRIERFELLGVTEVAVGGVVMRDCTVEVDCSPGTYVRALARDLGETLGCGAHLTALRRTRVGSFTLAEARSVTDEAGRPDLIGMAAVARRCFTTLSLTDEQAHDVRHGRRLREVGLPAELTALLGPDGELMALYRRSGADAAAEAVFLGS